MDYTNRTKTEIKRIEEISDKIRNLMDKDLYGHSVGTMEKAKELFRLHYSKTPGPGPSKKELNGLEYRIILASLLHDYAKIFSYDKLIKEIGKNKWHVDDFSLVCKPILHSFAGGYLVKRDFSIDDSTVLDAIKYHSTGRKNMNIIEKIIYISDKIEKTREYDGIGHLRDLSVRDLDACLIETYRFNIIYLLNKKQALHPDTCGIWNNILEVQI